MPFGNCSVSFKKVAFMEEKSINQFNNFGTIHQFNAGANATLIYNGEESVRSARQMDSCDETTSPPSLDAIQELALYVHDADRRATIVEQLRRALTARDIAFRVVADMEDLPTIDSYVVVKQKFIQPLLDLAVNVVQGRSINNVREQINKMLMQNKWKK